MREKRDQQGAACTCPAVYLALLRCSIYAWRASRQVAGRLPALPNKQVLRGKLPALPKNKCCSVSSRRSHSKLPERSHIANPQATSLINEHLAGVAASEPGRVSARIGAGCPVEGKARPARCGMRLSCCLLSITTLFDLCVACFGVSCGQAARAPKKQVLRGTAGAKLAQ